MCFIIPVASRLIFLTGEQLAILINPDNSCLIRFSILNNSFGLFKFTVELHFQAEHCRPKYDLLFVYQLKIRNFKNAIM